MPTKITPGHLLPSAEVLRSLFNYDPDTGVLTWKIKPLGGRRQVGDVAGYIHSTGYWWVGVRRRHLKAHRVIWCWMTGEWPVDEVDHINRNSLDNRWANLRQSNRWQNNHNMSRRTNRLGLKGVTRRGNRYMAVITVNGRYMYLGLFADVEDAIRAYDTAAVEHLGEFALTNAALIAKRAQEGNPSDYIERSTHQYSRRRKDNASGTIGVHWCNTNRRWVAQITINGQGICLGYFREKADAVEARRQGEIQHLARHADGSAVVDLLCPVAEKGAVQI